MVSKFEVGCGFHITLGTRIICIMEIVTMLAHVSGIYANHRWFLIVLLLAILTPIFLAPFVAIKRVEPKWMIPYLCLSVILKVIKCKNFFIIFAGVCCNRRYFGNSCTNWLALCWFYSYIRCKHH